MDIKDYPSNSHVSKREDTVQERRKVEKVVTGKVTTKKKGFLTEILSEEARNIKTYFIKDIIIPNIRKTILDTVDILFGGSKNNKTYNKISYRSFYDEPRKTIVDSRSGIYNYEDIVIETRLEAEEVLSQLNDMIDTYQIASVADLCDLVGITCDYTNNKYGWTNLRTADVVRVRDGYMLRLPKALPIK